MCACGGASLVYIHSEGLPSHSNRSVDPSVLRCKKVDPDQCRTMALTYDNTVLHKIKTGLRVFIYEACALDVHVPRNSNSGADGRSANGGASCQAPNLGCYQSSGIGSGGNLFVLR